MVLKYINPLELLEIQSLSPLTIQNAKQKLLKKIEASEKGYILFKNKPINRYELQRLVSELEHDINAAIHLHIYNTPLLKDFLQSGNPKLFEKPYLNKPWMDRNIIQMVAPYFRDAYYHTLAAAYKNRNHVVISNMVTHLPPDVFGQQGQLFEQTRKLVAAEESHLKLAKYRISQDWTNSSLNRREIIHSMTSSIHIESLNALPEFFKELKIEIVKHFHATAIFFHDHLKDYRAPFMEMIGIADLIASNPVLDIAIKEDFNRLQSTYYQLLNNKELNLDEEAQNITSKFQLQQKYIYTVNQEGQLEVKPNFSNIQQTVADLKSKLRENISYHIEAQISASVIMALINLIDDSLVNALNEKSNFNTRKMLLSDLYTILRITGQHYPTETLKMVSDIATLFKWDAHFQKQYSLLAIALRKFQEELDIYTFEELLIKEKAIEEESKKIAVYNGENKFVFGLRQIVHSLKTEQRVGPHKVVALFTLICVISMVSILSYRMADYLITKPVESTDFIIYKKPNYSFKIIPIEQEAFYKERSLYKGNQLRNGIAPFTNCFGMGKISTINNNTLEIENPTTDDAVIVVFNFLTNEVVRHGYLRVEKTLTLKNIPNGHYKIKVYAGNDWNPKKPNFCSLHGAFDTNPHYLSLSRKHGYLNLKGNTRLKVNLEGETKEGYPHFYPISASSFFNNVVWGEKPFNEN